MLFFCNLPNFYINHFWYLQSWQQGYFKIWPSLNNVYTIFRLLVTLAEPLTTTPVIFSGPTPAPTPLLYQNSWTPVCAPVRPIIYFCWDLVTPPVLVSTTFLSPGTNRQLRTPPPQKAYMEKETPFFAAACHSSGMYPNAPRKPFTIISSLNHSFKLTNCLWIVVQLLIDNFFFSPAATLLAGPGSQKGSLARVGPREGGVASHCRGCGSCLLPPASPELPFDITSGCRGRCVSYMLLLNPDPLCLGLISRRLPGGCDSKTTKSNPRTGCQRCHIPEHSTVASVLFVPWPISQSPHLPEVPHTGRITGVPYDTDEPLC